MKEGTLFRVKGSDYVFRVIDNPSMGCELCCAREKERLCKKMPFCQKICFVRLSSYEARQVKKNKEVVEYYEN